MAGKFYISPLNPFKFTDVNAAADPKYNPIPNTALYYPQKWQKTDTGVLQIASDYSVTVNALTCAGYQYQSIPVATTTTVMGQAFTVYTFNIDFAGFAEGEYILQVLYNDGSRNVELQSEIMDVRTLQEHTILYEYTNTRNDKGVIFQNGLTFQFRVEGLIWDYQPGSENQTYVDQYYNTAQENSIPYEKYTNFIGGPSGLIPDWMMKLVNWIYSVDKVRINNIYFTRASGDETLKVNRAGGSYNQNSFAQIDIMPQENYNLEELYTADLPAGNYRMVQDSKQFNPITQSFKIESLFKKYSMLEGFSTLNIGQSAYTIKIGTQDGTDDVMLSTDVGTELCRFLNINHTFNAATTVYVTITAASPVNLDIWADYKQYDAANKAPSIRYKIGTGAFWEGAYASFIAVWDTVTGYGKPDSGFENCQIVDQNTGNVILPIQVTPGAPRIQVYWRANS